MQKGFTLIELMVVVVIIGVLSAIALPQYTKALNRSRLTEALTNVGNLQRGIDTYCMQFPNEPQATFMASNGTRLDIDLKNSLTCDGSSCSGQFFSYEASCQANCASCSITVSALAAFPDLPTLQAERTKTGLRVSWTKTCTDGESEMCARLISEGNGFN